MTVALPFAASAACQGRTIPVMRISRHGLRVFSRLVLLVLLSAQGIHAAQACFADAKRPTMAFSGGHCGTPGQSGHVDPNACLSQCLQSDQSSSGHQVELPGPMLATVLVLPSEPSVHVSSVLWHAAQRVLETGPPAPIRFCSFLL